MANTNTQHSSETIKQSCFVATLWEHKRLQATDAGMTERPLVVPHISNMQSTYMKTIWFPYTPDVDCIVIAASRNNLSGAPADGNAVYIACMRNEIL